MSGDIRPLFLFFGARRVGGTTRLNFVQPRAWPPCARSRPRLESPACREVDAEQAETRYCGGLSADAGAFWCVHGGCPARAPTPDGDGTGGIRDSSPDADIDACAWVCPGGSRRNATQQVSARRLRPVLRQCKRPAAQFAAAGYRLSVGYCSWIRRRRSMLSPAGEECRRDGAARSTRGAGRASGGRGCCTTCRTGGVGMTPGCAGSM